MHIQVDSNEKENGEKDCNFTFDFSYINKYTENEERQYVAIKKLTLPKTFYEVDNMNNKISVIVNDNEYIFQLAEGNYSFDDIFFQLEEQMNEFFTNISLNVKIIVTEFMPEIDTGKLFFEIDPSSTIEEIDIIIEDEKTMMDYLLGLEFNELFSINKTGRESINQVYMEEENVSILCNLISDDYENQSIYTYPLLCNVHHSDTPNHSMVVEYYDITKEKKYLNMSQLKTQELKVEIISSSGYLLESLIGCVEMDIVCFNYQIPREELFDVGRDIELFAEKIRLQEKVEKKKKKVDNGLEELKNDYVLKIDENQFE